VSESSTQSSWFDAFLGFLLLSIGGYFANASWRLPAGPDPSAPGPGVAPGLLGIALVLCGAVLTLQAVIAQSKRLPSKTTTLEATASGATKDMRRKPVIAIILLGTCAALLESFGFMLSTFLFLFAGFILLGNARWQAAVSAAAITSVSLWLFFTKLLGVGLPFGRLVEILFY
jgi:putative tricarboxylic transport membrane protein